MVQIVGLIVQLFYAPFLINYTSEKYRKYQLCLRKVPISLAKESIVLLQVPIML